MEKPAMREIVVVSGKGGTGKTSLAASFAVLANRAVVADCDVDAADLHLILSPEVKERHEFKGGYEAVISSEECVGCGECLARCRFGAVMFQPEGDSGPAAQLNCFSCPSCKRSCSGRTNAIIQEMQGSQTAAWSGEYVIDPVACEGCGVCVRSCPVQAIGMHERICGEWMISQTRCGPMVHARLAIAAENSGKLVSIVRREARRAAEAEDCNLIIVDAPPGIGCPVIASVTGATLVLVVTEPSVSGEHDLERVLSLTRHFGIPALVCVNKWDINSTMTERIENKALRAGAHIAGRVRYDPGVTLAQLRERAAVETEAPSGEDIRAVWEYIFADEGVRGFV